MQHRRVEVVEVEIDVVLLADATAFADFQRHAARDHVARDARSFADGA